MKQAVFLVVMACGIAVAPALQAQSVLTPAQMQAKLQSLGDGASDVQTSRTVIGKQAIRELDARLGSGEFSLNRFGFDSSPFSAASTDVQVTLVHSAVMTRSQALSSMQGNMTAQLAVGDTVIHNWTEGGWSYSVTERWDGKQWQMIAFSATKMGAAPA